MTKNLRWFLLFSAPLAATFLAMSGVGFYLTFVSLYFSHRSYSEFSIGIVQGMYFLGLFLGAWFLEGLVRRIGHIQVLALSGSLLAATILIQSFSDNLFLWGLTRLLAGFALAAFYVVVECWMLDHADFKQRGLALSLYMFVLNAGYAIGQQMIPLISFDSKEAFILGSLLVVASIVPVALSTEKLTLPKAESGLCISKLVRISPFGTMSCLICGVLLSALYSFLAIAGEGYGTSGSQLIAVMVLGGLLAQWPLGKLSDLFDRRFVLLGLSLFVFLSSALLSSGLAQLSSALYLLVFVLGATLFTIYPVSLTQVADHLNRDQLTAGTASLLLLYSAGCVIGPLLSSFAMSYLGAAGLFLFSTFFSALVSALGLLSVLKKSLVPEEEKELFVPLPRTTSIAYELDPRVEKSPF